MNYRGIRVDAMLRGFRVGDDVVFPLLVRWSGRVEWGGGLDCTDSAAATGSWTGHSRVCGRGGEESDDECVC